MAKTRIDPESARSDPEPPAERGSYLTRSRAEALEASLRRLEDHVDERIAAVETRTMQFVGLATELTRLVNATVRRGSRG